MEVVKQWSAAEPTAEEVEEDVSLQRKRFRQNSNIMKTYEEDSRSSSESSLSESPNFLIPNIIPVNKTQIIEIKTSEVRFGAVKNIDEKIEALPVIIEQQVAEDSLSCGIEEQVSLIHEMIQKGEVEKEIGELYLETVYDNPGSHKFYCPKCNSSITKVVIRERELDIRERELEERVREFESRLNAEPKFGLADMFRCNSCFGFLVPIGNWFFPKRASPDHKDPVSSPLAVKELPESDFKPEFLQLLLGPPLVDGRRAQDESLDDTKETTISIVEDFRVGTVVQSQESMEMQYDPETQDPLSASKVGVNIIGSKNPAEITILAPALAPIEGKKADDPTTGIEEIPSPKGLVSITVINDMPELINLDPSRESQRWQILKSIVYGGLAESITSLGIVTSAASADTKTVNIVVLALANLIGGLFVIGNNLRDLKNDKFQRSRGETEEQVDRYGEALGEREHIALHFSIVILSFLVFGLIPPIVYGFSFRVSDDRDFKMAAVAATSLVCISLLALGKAHIQRPSKWQKYITVLFYYLGIGIGVSGLSYLAGVLIGKLLDKFGWFKASSGAELLLPGMGFSELGFGSY